MDWKEGVVCRRSECVGHMESHMIECLWCSIKKQDVVLQKLESEKIEIESKMAEYKIFISEVKKMVSRYVRVKLQERGLKIVFI